MTPKKIKIQIKNLDKHLFLSNFTDPSRRDFLLENSEGNIWPHISRYLEEDTGVSLTNAGIKVATYASLYGASVPVITEQVNSSPFIVNEVFPEEVDEVRNWIFEVSNSPIFRMGRRRGISHLSFVRDLQARVYDRFRNNNQELRLGTEEIEITFFNSISERTFSHNIAQLRNLIEIFTDDQHLGNSEGLFTITVEGL